VITSDQSQLVPGIHFFILWLFIILEIRKFVNIFIIVIISETEIISTKFSYRYIVLLVKLNDEDNRIAILSVCVQVLTVTGIKRSCQHLLLTYLIVCEVIQCPVLSWLCFIIAGCFSSKL